MMLLALLILTWGWTTDGHEPPAPAAAGYISVEAQPGDGIYSLLRRYQLDKYSCNFARFYELNKLKRNARLLAGRRYQLPIQVYTYNGKSIRSTIGNEDWDLAVSIQKYNQAMEAEGVRRSSYQTDKVLWVPHHLLHCTEPDRDVPAPVTPQTRVPPPPKPQVVAGKVKESSSEVIKMTTTDGPRRFTIFGEDHAHVPLVSRKLQGKIFYIDSGHGGPDPGAMVKRGSYTLCEDEYAYDVSLRLCRNLVAHGATAYMITRDPNDGIRGGKYLDCDSDEVYWGNIPMYRNHKARLFQRSDIINDLYEHNRRKGLNDQLVITVHVDSRGQSERTDLYFYHHPTSEEGRDLARELQRKLRSKYKTVRADGDYRGTVTGRDLHMLREVQAPGVYIELANIRNVSDQQRIILETNRQLLADWLLEGILEAM